MADGNATDDQRAELERLETEIAGLAESIGEVRGSLTDGGPMDPEDRAAALTQIEELEAVRSGLERRRDSLREQIGA